MTADIDIFRTANKLIKQHGDKKLIKQHGDKAVIEAAMRADERLDKGDMDGLAVWKRIVKAVDELLSEAAPTESDPIH